MSKLNLGVDVLPTLNTDSGDRNRTSPFAFTGNKFEFRMPGSSSTPATSAAAINAAVGKVLKEYADKLEKTQKRDLDKTITEIITNAYKKHGEAEKRGLTNELSSNLALRKHLDSEILQMTEETGMLSKQESIARYNAYAERYVTHLVIESKTLIDIANKDILPAGLKYANLLADNIEKVSKFNKNYAKEQELLLKEVIMNVTNLRKEIKSLEKKIEKVKNEKDLGKKTDLATGLESLRVPCDNLEKVVDNSIWALPTYKDLLFKL